LAHWRVRDMAPSRVITGDRHAPPAVSAAGAPRRCQAAYLSTNGIGLKGVTALCRAGARRQT